MQAHPQRDSRELSLLSASQLTTAEQFVIGACRCWDAFIDSADRSLGWRELFPVFAYMNVLGALCAFERAFDVIRAHHKRPLAFYDGDSAEVGVDEARILFAVASLQRGQVRAVTKILSGTLTRAGVRALLPPLARIAAVLDVQGHRLPFRSTPTLDSLA